MNFFPKFKENQFLLLLLFSREKRHIKLQKSEKSFFLPIGEEPDQVKHKLSLIKAQVGLSLNNVAVLVSG